MRLLLRRVEALSYQREELLITVLEMSVELFEIPHRSSDDGVAPFTALEPRGSSASSSAESDSDGGYGTPAENFADDELHADDVGRAPSPIPAVTRTQAGDSASTEGVVVVVDPELRERIVKQVEWYFSDENLLKDSFLMKHINRNKQGYVSLKLVASFRKVKSLTKDWRVVLTSVRQSSLLALSEDETKIRRLAPPPQIDYTHVSRTVVVTNYPNDEPNANSVETQFGRFGEVTLVRILHPGKAIPLDVKPSRSRHPAVGKELCILVEYESVEGARVACNRFKEQQSWRDEMKVQLLTADTKDKHSHRQETEKTTKIVAPIDAGWKSKSKRKQPGDRKQGTHVKESSQNRLHKDSSPPARHLREGSPSSSGYKIDASQHWRRHSGQPGSPDMPRRYLQAESWRDYASDSGCSTRSPSQSPKSSPEPTKKFSSSEGAVWRRHVHTRDTCVVRQPLGPDSTRGFHGTKRSIKISVESC